MEQYEVKLAYDLIDIKDKDNPKRLAMDTLDSLGIDYSKMIEEEIKKGGWDEFDDIADAYISLAHEEKLGYMVLKALVQKGLITKDNCQNMELCIMTWQYIDGQYAEYGYVNISDMIQMGAPFGAYKLSGQCDCASEIMKINKYIEDK